MHLPPRVNSLLASLLCLAGARQASADDAMDQWPLEAVVSNATVVFVGVPLEKSDQTQKRSIGKGRSWDFHYRSFKVQSVLRSDFPLKPGEVVRIWQAQEGLQVDQSVAYQEQGLDIGMIYRTSGSPSAVTPSAGEPVVVLALGAREQLEPVVIRAFEPLSSRPRIEALLVGQAKPAEGK